MSYPSAHTVRRALVKSGSRFLPTPLKRVLRMSRVKSCDTPRETSGGATNHVHMTHAAHIMHCQTIMMMR